MESVSLIWLFSVDLRKHISNFVDGIERHKTHLHKHSIGQLEILQHRETFKMCSNNGIHGRQAKLKHIFYVLD